MALGINTNVASINAQNQLNSSKDLNSEALERLSSGLRINSAADDAAGLAISTRFESQITGLETATRNANDGISLAQTAEGALDEVNSNLQRVRELAVQAANATNNGSDREALNDEVQQRIEEINRIADTTAFNGLNVLDGSLKTQDFQVGANAGETIEFDLSKGAKADQIGELASAEVDFTNSTSGNPSFSGGGEFTVQVGTGDSETISISEGDNAADIASALESKNIQGVSSVESESVAELQYTALGSGGGASGGDAYSFDVSLGGKTETIEVSASTDGDTVTSQEFADAINQGGPEGLSASASGGTISLSADSGENITLTENSDDFTNGGVSGGISTSGDTYVGTVNIDASEDITVTNDSDNSIAQLNDTDLAASSGGSAALTGSLDGVSVTTVDNANDAIKRADSAMSAINEIRSGLGAIQNRFESTINNLSNSVENLSAANSRIRDADFASETAKLAKSQVLQQAGISVLSQANQRPQQVLSLLQ